MPRESLWQHRFDLLQGWGMRREGQGGILTKALLLLSRDEI